MDKLTNNSEHSLKNAMNVSITLNEGIVYAVVKKSRTKVPIGIFTTEEEARANCDKDCKIYKYYIDTLTYK